jgi:hypothetical protein
MSDFRRAPFKEKFVKDLNFNDFKVAVSGSVIGKQEKGFLLSDGSGEVYVNFSALEGSIVCNDNDTVRVFGRIVPYDGGFELQAEIVQNMLSVDKAAMNRLKESIFK